MLSKKNENDRKISPITEKKNELENALKKDNTTDALAKAIKSILNKK